MSVAIPEIPGDTQRPHYHSQALSRGLEALRVVATTQGNATLTHIHESTGVAKSTLVRLLAVLEDEHYLVRVDERPAYRLGDALLPIAAAFFDSVSAADLIRPHLASLARLTGWTSNFGVLDGQEVLHLCVEYPERPIHYTTKEGSAHSAYNTALGKAILSELPDDVVDHALPPEPFRRFTPHTIVTRDEMRRDLERTRERGYAIDAGEADTWTRCLAVPIVSETGVLGAVSVSGSSGEATPEREAEFLDALRRTRDAILRLQHLPGALRASTR